MVIKIVNNIIPESNNPFGSEAQLQWTINLCDIYHTIPCLTRIITKKVIVHLNKTSVPCRPQQVLNNPLSKLPVYLQPNDSRTDSWAASPEKGNREEEEG